MFGQNVTTNFVGEIADELFPKIKVGHHYADDSFVGTARAVLAPRLPVDFAKEIVIDFLDCSDGDEVNAGRVLCDIDSDVETLRIVSIPQSEGDEQFDRIAEMIAETRPEFQQDMKVKAFFGQFAPKIMCASFLDSANHNTLIFVAGLNTRIYHAIQSALPRFFPWYFAESKATPEERTLLLSLCNRTPNTQTVRGEGDAQATTKPGYIDLLSELEKRYDFRNARIKKMIPLFIANSEQAQIDSVAREMRQLDEQYENYERYLRDITTQRRDLEIRMAGLQTLRGHGDDGGLTDWFKSVDQVELVSADEGNLTFEVYTNLEWWDDDLAPEYVRNQNSDMYTKTAGMKKDSWGLLMNAIFVDRTMFIRTCAAYRMRIGDTVAGLSGYTFSKDRDTRIPNSHIQYHACTGAYRSAFRDAIRRGDYVLGMETAVTSAKSMNFSDISFSEFIRDMGDNKDKKFIADADGNLYTPAEAVKYLKKLNKEESKG